MLTQKKSSLFSFYALPSGGKSKDAVVHSKCCSQRVFSCVAFHYATLISHD